MRKIVHGDSSDNATNSEVVPQPLVRSSHAYPVSPRTLWPALALEEPELLPQRQARVDLHYPGLDVCLCLVCDGQGRASRDGRIHPAQLVVTALTMKHERTCSKL